MSDEGKRFVPSGVFLTCDKGVAPSILTVMPKMVELYDEMLATELDKIPMLNVKTFGTCACQMGNPCVPAPIQWMKVFENEVLVSQGKPLLEDSFLMCSFGGKIEIHFSKITANASIEANNNYRKKELADRISEESETAKALSEGLFWGGVLVGGALLVGGAAVLLTGGAALPLLAGIAGAMAEGALVGGVTNGVIGGIAGGIQTGSLEGAAEGAWTGAVMGAVGGAVSGGIGLLAAKGAFTAAPVVAKAANNLFKSSMAALGVGVALDGVALAVDPTEARARSLVSGLVLVGAGKLIEKAAKPSKARPVEEVRLAEEVRRVEEAQRIEEQKRNRETEEIREREKRRELEEGERRKGEEERRKREEGERRKREEERRKREEEERREEERRKREDETNNDDSITKPSMKPDNARSPRGRKTHLREKANPDEKRSLRRENEVADTLAQNGYNIEQNPPSPTNKNPDYLIEGRVFDCYSPKATSSSRNIWSNIKRSKIDTQQTDRVILDLKEWTGDMAELQKQFSEHEMPNLKEVKVIGSDNSIFNLNLK